MTRLNDFYALHVIEVSIKTYRNVLMQKSNETGLHWFAMVLLDGWSVYRILSQSSADHLIAQLPSGAPTEKPTINLN